MHIKNKVKFLIMSGLCVSMLYTTAFAADNMSSSEIKAELNSIQQQMQECKNFMNNAHSHAELIRNNGGEEDHYVIQSAKVLYTNANDTYKNLSNQFVELTQVYNQQVKVEAARYNSSNNKRYLGRFRISYYCPCKKCCGNTKGITASGRKLTPYTSVAVDSRVIPLGSTISINGKQYRCDDKGGAIKGNRIDVCVSSHSEALRLGVRYADVYIIK